VLASTNQTPQGPAGCFCHFLLISGGGLSELSHHFARNSQDSYTIRSNSATLYRLVFLEPAATCGKYKHQRRRYSSHIACSAKIRAEFFSVGKHFRITLV